MRVKCTAKNPVVVLLHGELEQVNPGQVIEVSRKPEGHFVIVEEPKPIKKAVKKITKRVIKNAYPTETSSVR